MLASLWTVSFSIEELCMPFTSDVDQNIAGSYGNCINIAFDLGLIGRSDAAGFSSYGDADVISYGWQLGSSEGHTSGSRPRHGFWHPAWDVLVSVPQNKWRCCHQQPIMNSLEHAAIVHHTMRSMALYTRCRYSCRRWYRRRVTRCKPQCYLVTRGAKLSPCMTRVSPPMIEPSESDTESILGYITKDLLARIWDSWIAKPRLATLTAISWYTPIWWKKNSQTTNQWTSLPCCRR